MSESGTRADTEHELAPGLVWLGAELRGADLTDVDLHGAVLTKSRFPGPMDRVNLMDADLTGASFRDANLASAILHEARLVGADFAGADLSYADFSEADLSDASLLSASKLHGLYLAGAKGIGLEALDADTWDDDVAWNEATSGEPDDERTIADRLCQRGRLAIDRLAA